MIDNKRMFQRHDTSVNWQSENPVLEAGEFGYEDDTGGLKIGDGVTQWVNLGYIGWLNQRIGDHYDVEYTALHDGQVLVFDETNNLWRNGDRLVIEAAMTFRGFWDADQNAVLGDAYNTQLVPSTPPDVPPGESPDGVTYVVQVGGTYDLGNGAEAWAVGDQAVWYTPTGWQRMTTASTVQSVFGRTGAVIAEDGDYTAQQVTNVPANTITATNVQSALNQLSNQKVNYTDSINALSDVDTATTAPQSGFGLVWDAGGGKWTPQRVGFSNVNILNDLGDVTVGVPAFGEVLTFATGQWRNSALPTATALVSGIIELATQAEVDAGADTQRAVTPATLQQKLINMPIVLDNLDDVTITSVTDGQFIQYDQNSQQWVNRTVNASVPPASETTAGIIELATVAETNAGNDDARAVTPLKLANKLANTSINDFADVDTSTTPPTAGQALVWDGTTGEWVPGTVSGGTPPDATETVKGILEIATQAETDGGTDDARAITPAKLRGNLPAIAGNGVTVTNNRLHVDLVDAQPSGLVFLGTAPNGELMVDIPGTAALGDALDTDSILLYSTTNNQLRSITKADFLGDITSSLKPRGQFTPGTPSATVSNVTGDPDNVTITQGVAPTGANPVGYTYYADSAGTSEITGTSESYLAGDSIIWNGTNYVKKTNSQAVTSVHGRTGDVVSSVGDYAALQVSNTPTAPITSTTVQGAIDELATLQQSYVPDTRQVIAGDGLSGGGALNGDITLSVGAGTNVTVAANLVNVPNANDVQRGAIEIATQAEVDAGVDSQRAVVPSTMANYVGAQIGGIALNDLADVDTVTAAPTDGQALVWDAANSEWVPGTVSGGTPPDATETVKGILEIATQGETDTGTNDTNAVTPLKLASKMAAQVIGDLADVDVLASTAPASNNILRYFNGVGWGPTDGVATETVEGLLPIATQAQVNTGTDDASAVTPLKLEVKLVTERHMSIKSVSGTAYTVQNTDTSMCLVANVSGNITFTFPDSLNVGVNVLLVNTGGGGVIVSATNVRGEPQIQNINGMMSVLKLDPTTVQTSERT